MDIHSLVEDKLAQDIDFQAEIEALSDEDKAQAIADKKAELINAEFADRDAKAKKAEEIANNQKIRAEKAEREAKNKPSGEPAPKTDDLSTKDLYALMEAKVSLDDIDEVVKAAKVLNLHVADAIKSPIVKAILSTKEEERKTATATNSGGSRRPAAKPTNLVEKFFKGEVPDSEDGFRELAEQRMAEKKAKAGIK